MIYCFMAIGRQPTWPGRSLSAIADPATRSTSFQLLANGLKFSKHLRPLCFQQLPTVKFSKSFVLITIRIAGGVQGLQPMACGVGSKHQTFTLHLAAERFGSSSLLATCDRAADGLTCHLVEDVSECKVEEEGTCCKES